MRPSAQVRLLAAAFSLSFTVAANAEAVLQVNGSGQLTGATGVNVNGSLYDVRFVDGTCSSLFSSCDQASDFAFTTLSEGQAAANALLNQVFVDSAAGSFDTSPQLTAGCASFAGSPECFTLIPYALFQSNALVTYSINVGPNDPFISADSVGQTSWPTTTSDTSPSPGFNWAIFTFVSSGVPEPATWAMMMLGFGGIGLAMRRRRQPAFPQVA